MIVEKVFKGNLKIRDEIFLDRVAERIAFDLQ